VETIMAMLEPIDGSNWEAFLQGDWSVLMLGKTDCDHCAAYGEELEAFLGSPERPTAVRAGKMLLDRGGLASFKRANPWLAEVDVLPYTLIYRRGEKVGEFAGGGVARLRARLARLGADTASLPR
jgi:hypothetical protein